MIWMGTTSDNMSNNEHKCSTENLTAYRGTSNLPIWGCNFIDDENMRIPLLYNCYQKFSSKAVAEKKY